MFRAATTICLEFGSLVAIEGFPVDFRRIFFFIRTHFEPINKYEVSGMCSTKGNFRHMYFCRSN
jgi:hypothetical protein